MINSPYKIIMLIQIYRMSTDPEKKNKNSNMTSDEKVNSWTFAHVMDF